MRFNKGELTQESLDAMIKDIECLEIQTSPDNEYFLSCIKKNLQTIWGLQTKNEKLEQQFIDYFHTLTSDEQNIILNDIGQ
jgi:hypothetical protein